MKLKHLSARDAITVLEIIQESLSARSEEHVRSLLLKLREVLPYQASIAAMARLDAEGAPGELQLVNVEYPEEYLQELWRTGLVWQDPILVENFRNYRLQYWADTFEQSPLKKANRDLTEDFGLHMGAHGQGYGHGARNRRGTRGSLFCWHGLDRDTRTEEVISLVVPHLHEAMSRIAGEHLHSSELTPRERDVLQWLAHGKTTWDISVILNISERTVKFHIANISRKLDASTRAHAVAIALDLGLIELD
jgi:DNA-binding CsgD family transcriptional regulator